MVLLPDPGPLWRTILERIPAPPHGRFHVVGGWVRDLLLLGPFSLGSDIDLVIDGDLSSWAPTVARAFGVELRLEPGFLTARIEIPGEGGTSVRIDMARFRREIYDFPGMLPRVFPGSMEEDARRRDFSMNAIFLEWSSEKREFTRVLDPTGGREDVRGGRIRPLKADIFLEDPTRLFRWARFSVRLGLSGDALLEGALERALGASGLWDRVGGARVFNEIERILLEPDPLGVIDLLFSSRIMESLAGISRLSRPRRQRLRRWLRFRGLLRTNGIPKGISAPPGESLDRAMFFLALLAGLPRRRFQAAAERLGLGARLRERLERVFYGPEGWPFAGFYAGLERETGRDPGRMRAVADRLDMDRVLFLALIGRESDLAFWEEYISRERWAPPLIGGEALLLHPRIPPAMRGTILAEVRVLQRTGILHDASEALRWLERKVSEEFP